MIAIETSAAPMTTMIGDGAEAASAIRSAWLAPGFYLAFLFGALFLLAIGVLLLWRLTKSLALFQPSAAKTLGSPWSGRHPSPTT